MVILEVGKQYFIRTSSYYYTGRVIEATVGDYRLEDAAWIPDTGRFADAMTSGEFAEVEPYPRPIRVNAQHVVDAMEWPHALPRGQ